MTGKLTIEVIADTGASLAAQFVNPGGGPHKLANRLINVLTQVDGGQVAGHVRVRVDDSTASTAAGTVAITYASLAAGDILRIVDPLYGATYFTCVSTAPVAGDNTFRKVTDATATASSLVTAINTSPQMAGRYTATSSTGTVTITAAGIPGAVGNKVILGKEMANGAGMTLVQFTGGRDGGSKQSLKATLGANPTNGQTFLIGAKTITFATAAANQNEVTIGASATATAAALAVVLAANTDVVGYFVVTDLGSAAVALERQESGGGGRFVSVGGTATSLAWTNTQTGVAATDFRPTTTELNKVVMQDVTLGLAAAAS